MKTFEVELTVIGINDATFDEDIYEIVDKIRNLGFSVFVGVATEEEGEGEDENTEDY